MSDGRILIYIYDGSFDGLLSAVHYAYYNREEPDEIVSTDRLQQNFIAQYVTIKTDSEKSKAVYNSIRKKISDRALYDLYLTYLSNEPDKATAIYKYLRLGYKLGIHIHHHLHEDCVLRVNKISGYVSMETHKLKGFVRFSEMEGGVLYSPITPVNNVLELLCPYFADRLPSQAWVICDTARHTAAIYDTEQWVIRDVDTINLPKYNQDEARYQQLWKAFYNAICINSRENPKLRMQMMPKRYWQNMTEFMPQPTAGSLDAEKMHIE